MAKASKSKLEVQFWAFHVSHPEIYELLLHYAREWRQARGPDARCGIGFLWERVRWQVGILRLYPDFKCNNNHRAYYARLLEARNPDLRGIFQFRQQRIPATFGPENDSLPSGVHVA